jgi:hypothetical protein
LIIICISDTVLISTTNVDLRSRSLPDSFFLLVVGGASSDAIKVVIEVSVEVVAFFVIKSFFILIFDLLEAGDASEVKI